MERNEIILYWILSQIKAGNIQPARGRKLAALVDPATDTDKARFIRVLISSHPSRKGRQSAAHQARTAAQGFILPPYDPDTVVLVISDMLQSLSGKQFTCRAVGRIACALTECKVLTPAKDRAALHLFLQTLEPDAARAAVWGKKDSFVEAFRHSTWSDDVEKRKEIITNFLLLYNLYRQSSQPHE